jgi:hypothetical protein
LIDYLALLPRLRLVARKHGYALAVHGSLQRDFDLIAAPWVEQVSSPAVLAEALRLAAGGVIEYGRPGRDPMQKPHGRLAWSIHLGGRQYIDLSVMPAYQLASPILG